MGVRDDAPGIIAQRFKSLRKPLPPPPKSPVLHHRQLSSSRSNSKAQQVMLPDSA